MQAEQLLYDLGTQHRKAFDSFTLSDFTEPFISEIRLDKYSTHSNFF